MNKNVKRMFFVLTLFTLLISVGVVCAADNTTITDTPSDTTTLSNTNDVVVNDVIKTSDNREVKTKNKTINHNKNKEMKKESNTIILNNSNFDDYFENNTFINNITDNDIIDIQGTIIRDSFKMNINKPLNFISSTNDGVLDFTSEDSFSGGSIKFLNESSGSNITDITFKNVQFTVTKASNIQINNITTLNEKKAIGNGVGSVSIRDGSENISITNSYFKSSVNGGHSNVVFAVAYNCLFENNTVESYGVDENGNSGMVGNIFYLTTYNVVEEVPVKNNINITIRNNIIRGIDIMPDQAICVGMMLEGYDHIIENNVIEKEENILGIQWVDPTWTDPETSVLNETGHIIFRNNTIIGKTGAGLNFKGEAYNNNITCTSTISQADCYNNTFENTVKVGNNATFRNNKVNNISIIGNNSNILNLTNITTLNVTGNYNNITNINVNSQSNITISGSNNIIQNNNITTNQLYALIITGENNTINNNYLESNILKGNTAIKYSSDTNIIENNTPESLNITITEDNYSEYFNDEGKLIQGIPDGSLILLKGNFNNKDFTLENVNLIINTDNLKLYNSTVIINGTSKLLFENFTIDNRNSDKKNALIIESDYNQFNNIQIYDDSNKANFTDIIVRGNNNNLTYNIEVRNQSSNEDNPSGVGLLVESENNIFNGKFMFNIYQGSGDYIGTILTSTSKNNTINNVNSLLVQTGTPNNTTSFIVSGNENIINTTYIKSKIILNNSNNSVINSFEISTSNTAAIILNNSNNNIINNITYRIKSNKEYSIELYNSHNNNITYNLIVNNQTYGGNNAVYLDDNSQDNYVKYNKNTKIILTEETYPELFTDGIFNDGGNIIFIDSDLYNRTLIFNKNVDINANNHTLYNSILILNHTTETTNISNININAINITTPITINGNSTINNITIYHENNDIITRSILINKNLTLNNANITTYGPSTSDDQISTIAIDINDLGLLKATNLNITLSTTKTDNGTITAIRDTQEFRPKNQYGSLNNLNINIETTENAIGILGSFEESSSNQNINITGNNVIGIDNSQSYNQTLNNIKLYITANNSAIGIINNNTEFINENKNMRNSQINISSNNTAIGIYEHNGRSNYQSLKIYINAPNSTGFELENLQREVNSNTIIINATNATGIKLTNTNYSGEIRSNTINMTLETGYAITLENISNRRIRQNNIQLNKTDKSILIENGANINITSNTIINEIYPGNLAVKKINSSDIIIKSNNPIVYLNLTDDNYNQHFNKGIYNTTEYDKIKLYSDLYNKNLTFNTEIEFEGNNYTIYNGTIVNNYTDGIKINNTNINNTNSIPTIISNGVICLTNNKFHTQTDNTTIIQLENNTSGVQKAQIYYNEITTQGNNNILISTNNYTLGNIYGLNYNNITSTGNNNTIIQIENQQTQSIIAYNNITINTIDPSNEIIINNATVILSRNNITVNTTQNNIVIIKVTNNTQTTVSNNNIESLDLMGNDAIETEGTKKGNTPIITINLTNSNYENYFENENFISGAEIINLASNLYNKNLIFTNQITLNGNGYTIYNGTITTKNKDTNIYIQNTTFNNTNNNATMNLSGNIHILNNNIYQEANNTNIITLNKNSILSEANYNNITLNGNNNTIIKLYGSVEGDKDTISYNNITSTGDDNHIIHAERYVFAITNYNNITIYTNTPTVAIQVDSYSTMSIFNYNKIIINTTQNNTPVINVTQCTWGEISHNYIESIDLVGNDAINTNAEKEDNTPTAQTGYLANIEINTNTIKQYLLNELNIIITDSMGNNITGTINATINGEPIQIENNKIKYTTTNTDNIDVSITYTDPTGKYNTKTTTKTLTITPAQLTVNPITATEGQTINITARITVDNETITDINKGKVVFKVNGKTLKDTNGKVIYAKVVNSTATIENYTVPDTWKEGSTIQAVYSGSSQCEKLTTEKININISKAVPTLTTESITTTTGSTITLKATITDNDKIINTGKIVFKINGKTVKDANGKVIYAKVVNNTVSVEYTLPEDMKAKDYTITATFVSSEYDKLTDEKTLSITA